MISAWLAGNGVVSWQLAAAVMFFLLFVGVLAWIFRPDSAQVYRREAHLPFDDAAQATGDGAVTKEDYHG